jgi:uncharacterized RDD family membrane protein YckC
MRRRGRRNGQTLGRSMLRIRVVREDGRPMDLSAAAMRMMARFMELLSFLAIVPLLYTLVSLSRDRARRSIAGQFTETVVTREGVGPLPFGPPT